MDLEPHNDDLENHQTTQKTKHGLHDGEKRQSIFYRKQKIRLQANINPDVSAIKRHTDSMLDTMERSLNEHLQIAERDGVDLDGLLLDDLIEMSSHTRAHQELLDQLVQIIDRK